MHTTKIFIKKNKIGNYLKHAREHYIRDDIYCGFEICDKCTRATTSLSSKHVNKCGLIKNNHYLILDTNVILDQIDVLEENLIGNVIILNTVLKEVKHRNMPIYKRLISIIENPSRHFYIFINDYNKGTYLKQELTELINDYNDRCIRKACSWYIEHIPDENFVLLTEDKNNRRIAQEENIPAYSIVEYVQNLTGNENLIDKLAKKEFQEKFNAADIFPPHLTIVEIDKGIKESRLHQGTFRASRDNFLEGSVNIQSFDEDVIIRGYSNLNRVIDGDVVAIEVFDKDQWVSPSELVLEDDTINALDDNLERKELEISKQRTLKKNIKPTGRIVGIIKRKWRQYCGILQEGSAAVYHLFLPADRKIPKIRIETRQAETLKTQKIIVAIDSWPRNSRYPNDEKVRVDLRGIDICSVDPPGCTDIDDALHCRPIGDDKLEVGVHIADVSHFIRPYTALDTEAAARSTTVYLVNKRIDMVPDLLSSNLCSLRGGEERFAFSCIWEMDHNANILNTKFHKSIIKSKRAMTYEEAQLTIDDKTQTGSLAQSLRNLNKLAKLLKKRRMDNGALVLASPEVKIMMDSETHDPIDVEVKKLFETNSMVEEFMLLANISVAEKILSDFPDCAVLRRHPEPPALNLEPLVKAGKHLGFEINIESGKKLAESLDQATRDDNPYLNTMLRILATRCMLQAVYFASGTFQKHEFFHYGLAVPLYTHFTSPIRRYADILVHRLLAVSCGADATYPDLMEKKKTADLCQNMNYRHRMAQYAGRASVALNTHLFFRGKIQDEKGYILYVRKNALQVLIPKYGLESTLYLGKKDEKLDIFTYNEEDQTQRCGDVVFHAFDPVTIRLSMDSKNIQHEKFVLQLVFPVIEGFSVPPLDDVEMTEPEVPQKKRKK
ncbi:ribonuclease [Holotrichia oblita]|uniref:Ribonuclease n=1 Tax=Holotrichia oblita TaxID=644536 RepID=A0ACB9TS16_HOLOL|nr:ribonuclease [Holotrichia oblita]